MVCWARVMIAGEGDGESTFVKGETGESEGAQTGGW